MAEIDNNSNYEQFDSAALSQQPISAEDYNPMGDDEELGIDVPGSQGDATNEEPVAEAKPEEAPVEEKKEEVPAQQLTPEIQAKITDYDNIVAFLNQPHVKAALQPVLNPQSPQQQAASEVKQEVKDAIAELTEEDVAAGSDNLVQYGNLIMKKVMASIQPLIEKRAAEIVAEKTGKYEQVYNEYQQQAVNNRVNQQITSLKDEFKGEADVFLTPNTPEYNSLVAEIQANPSLTLRQAFLILRGSRVNGIAEAKAKDIVANKQKMSMPTGNSKTEMRSVSKNPRTPREAILRAMGELK